MKNSWHVATAAEAIAAAQFARCGWDVSVQYGANQPEYDLLIARGEPTLKVSVKGSKDGAWGLTQSFKKNSTYHEAVEKWLSKHSKKTIFCLVQFNGVEMHEMPRLYLATPGEIAELLKKSAAGRGDTVLWENQTWTKRAQAAGTTDRIPESWRFTEERLDWLASTV